jgi:hypothetical protein
MRSGPGSWRRPAAGQTCRTCGRSEWAAHGPAYRLAPFAQRFFPVKLDLPAFHDLRVFRGGLRAGALRWPAGVTEADGLPLDRARREMAPSAIAHELRALEAQGCPSPYSGLIQPPSAADDRARDLIERLRALLQGELAAEARFVAVGVWPGGNARVPGAWFRVPGLDLSWDEARVQHDGLALTDVRVFSVKAAPSVVSADEVLAGLVRVDDSPGAGANGGPRPKDPGGRPEEYDRLKIGNEVRRYAERNPDGLPVSARQQRDLVRRICRKLFGSEPARSTLYEIMKDLELR